MRTVAILGVAFGAAGLVIGYLIFARTVVTGDLIPVADLFGGGQSVLGRIVGEVRQIVQIRRNILLCGGGGLVAGAALGFLIRGRR